MNLVEIVIFRGHPKNRHGWNAVLRQFLCNLDGRQSLIDGVSRPAKQSHLLPRNNRNRSLFKSVQIGERLGSGPKSDILPAKNRRDFRSSIVRIVDLLSRALHRGHGRRMSVEGLHSFKMIEVFKKKLRLMGELAKGEDTAIHEMLDDTRTKTSHQIWQFVAVPIL